MALLIDEILANEKLLEEKDEHLARFKTIFWHDYKLVRVVLHKGNCRDFVGTSQCEAMLAGIEQIAGYDLVETSRGLSTVIHVKLAEKDHQLIQQSYDLMSQRNNYKVSIDDISLDT